MFATPVHTLRRGEMTTMTTARTVRWAGRFRMSSRVAALLPFGLRPHSSSTANPLLLPNPNSHSTWTKKRGIPDELATIRQVQFP